MPVSNAELVKENAEVQRLKPAFADIQAAFKDRVEVDDKGKFKVDLTGSKEDVGKLLELRRPWARKATEVSNKRSEQNETIAAIGPDGSRRRIPATTEADAARRGFRPAVTGRRRRITSESQIRREMEEAAKS